MKPVVSVVIVNWNTCDDVRNCLQSIAAQTDVAHEIVVVDNASLDGSVSMIRDEFPATILIVNDKNRGFAAANNQGVLASTGRWVLLLNPDTLILDQAIDRMVEWCESRPDVGCAGCQVMEADDVIQRTCFADPSLFRTILTETGLSRLLGRLAAFDGPFYSSWDRKSEKEVHVVSGMFMLLPRPVLDKVGMLDEAFFIYAEEADLCRRIRAAGYRCVFAPVARIVHLDGGGKSTSQIKPRMRVQLQKSFLIYIRKHDGYTAAALARGILIVSNLLRWSLFRLGALFLQNAELRDRADVARALLLFHLLEKEPSA